MGAAASITTKADAIAAGHTDDQVSEYLQPLKALLPQPETPKYKMVVIGFTAPGGPEMNTDKDKTGVRYDSTPIANGVIRAGGSCVLTDYTPDDHDGFAAKVSSPISRSVVRV